MNENDQYMIDAINRMAETYSKYVETIKAEAEIKKAKLEERIDKYNEKDHLTDSQYDRLAEIEDEHSDLEDYVYKLENILSALSSNS